jgi:ATP-dependent RNA helicase DDX3X
MPGRTARIGNEGLATSFYCEKDADIAADLVKILIESKQKVPDFLEQYKPQDTLVNFHDDTDDESEDEAGNEANDGSAAWGGVQIGGDQSEAPATDGWE